MVFHMHRNGIGNSPFELLCRKAPAVFARFAGNKSVRDIIPNSATKALGIGWRKTLARLIPEFAEERSRGCGHVGFCYTTSSGACRLQFDLHVVPKVFIDDGGVQARPDLVLVPHEAAVDRVGEHCMELATTEGSSTLHPPTGKDAALGEQPSFFGSFGGRIQAPLLEIELEKRPHSLRLALVDNEFGSRPL